MTDPAFIISTGGRIVSTLTGDTVLTVNLDALEFSDAVRVIQVTLTALNKEYVALEDENGERG